MDYWYVSIYTHTLQTYTSIRAHFGPQAPFAQSRCDNYRVAVQRCSRGCSAVAAY